MIKFLVSGDRHWVPPDFMDFDFHDAHDLWMTRQETVYTALRSLQERYSIPDASNILIIEGGALGVDRLCRTIATDRCGYKIQTYPADWRFGKAAGPIRNKKMLDENRDIILVLAFHDNILSKSRGTLNMVRYAQKKGYAVEVRKSDGSLDQDFSASPQVFNIVW